MVVSFLMTAGCELSAHSLLSSCLYCVYLVDSTVQFHHLIVQPLKGSNAKILSTFCKTK